LKKSFFMGVIVLFIVGCGKDNVENSSPYDMWQYIASSIDYEFEYKVYENGNYVDYIIETNRVLKDGEVRQENNRGEYFLLTRNSENIVVKNIENNSSIVVQRYVSVGDEDIIDSVDIGSCHVEAYYRSKTILSLEFYNVVQINCLNREHGSIYYYAYDEGLVGLVNSRGSEIEERVKVDERRL